MCFQPVDAEMVSLTIKANGCINVYLFDALIILIDALISTFYSTYLIRTYERVDQNEFYTKQITCYWVPKTTFIYNK